MKLRDALENMDFSLFKEIHPATFYFHDDTLSEILYHRDNEIFEISYEHFEAIEKSGRVKQFAIREWLCTDTIVGLYLYLIDDIPVCIAYHPARKSSPEWYFISKYTLQITRLLFDEYLPDMNLGDAQFVDKDLMNLRLSEDLFKRDISNEQMEKSPMLSYSHLYKISQANSKGKESEETILAYIPFREEVKRALDIHYQMVEELKRTGTQQEVDEFEAESAHIYEFLKEELKKC